MADDFIKAMDWDAFDMGKGGQETQDWLEECTAPFFKDKTKRELYDKALEIKMGLCPVSTSKDLAENSQLKSSS